MGEYHHNLDEKGRIIIPSKFREEIGNKIVITRGLDECLFAYSMEEWNEIVKKLKTLPFTKQNARNFNRMFMSAATVCEFDKQGRINIAPVLSKYASLLKECVILGVNDRLEIWSIQKWDNFLDSNKDELSNLADNLFETNFEV